MFTLTRDIGAFYFPHPGHVLFRRIDHPAPKRWAVAAVSLITSLTGVFFVAVGTSALAASPSLQTPTDVTGLSDGYLYGVSCTSATKLRRLRSRLARIGDANFQRSARPGAANAWV